MRLGWQNNFAIFAPKRHFDIGHEDGVVFHGYWREKFDQAFYIYKLHSVEEGKFSETGQTFFFWTDSDGIGPETIEEYKELEEKDLDQKRDMPFISTANRGMNHTRHTHSTLSVYLEDVCFYQSIRDILEFSSLAKRHGSETLWSDILGEWRAERIVFDGSTKNKITGDNLKALINSLASQPQNLVITHFIDEQDIFCRAQSEFINLVVFYLTEEFKQLNVTIIDVVVRDTKGRIHHNNEFREYMDTHQIGPSGELSHNEPTSFVMVSGKPSEDKISIIKGHIDFEKRLDFNLFNGCYAAKSDEEADVLYKRNFRKIMHDLFCIGGLVAGKAFTRIRDFRGFPEEKVNLLLWDFESNAVVVKLHTQKRDITKMVTQLCSHLKLTGCPYVELIITDGPEDIAEIHNDTDTYVEFNNANGGEEFSCNLEGTVRELYLEHKLNGAAPGFFYPGLPQDNPRGKEQKTPFLRIV